MSYKETLGFDTNHLEIHLKRHARRQGISVEDLIQNTLNGWLAIGGSVEELDHAFLFYLASKNNGIPSTHASKFNHNHHQGNLKRS